MKRFTQSRLVSAIAWVTLVLVPRPASAQSQASTGQIAGVIVDASGGAIPGVTVTISSAATGIRRQIVTNERGLYSIPLLPSGTYDLCAELHGFKTLKEAALEVTVGSTITRDLTMQVGDVSETVNVTNLSAVDVTDPIASTTLGVQFIEKLPVNGRRFQDLVVLTPHAQVDIQRGQIALSGQRGVNANISIDGADYGEPFFGGIRGGSRSNFAPTIPQEAIREFQVVASGYSAEFGRSSGGRISVVTRSGTNRPVGSGFYLNRHRDLAAVNAFGQQAAPTQHQWGGSLGGPIRRDRSFFFVAYEQQDISIPRGVLFPALQNLTRTDETREAFDYFKSLEEPYTQTNDGLTFLGRIDSQLTAATRFNVRYSSSRNTGLNAVGPGNSSFPTAPSALSHNGTERDQISTVVGQLTNARRSNLLFEVRVQYSREHHPIDANLPLAPRVANNTVGRFGTVSFLGKNMTLDWRGQAGANATWIAGRHTVKAGAESNYVFVDSIGGLSQTGEFMVSGTDPARFLETLSVGGSTPNRFDSATTVMYRRQLGNLQQSMTTTEVAAFVQDSWRVTPTFTLTYGLRWEGQWYPSPQADNTSLVNRLKGFTFPSGRRVDPSVVPDAPAQVAPRVGFSWDPEGHANTVVRGNAGVYYARSPGIIFAGPLGNFRRTPADLTVRLPFAVPAGNPNTVYGQLKLVGIDLNQTPLDGLPIVKPEEIALVARALGLPDPYFGVEPFLIDPDFRNPKSYHWGFGFERTVAAGFTIGADYSDVKTVNLERNVDLNLPLPYVRDSDPARRPFFGLSPGAGGRRPIESLGQVTVREASARSQYRGLSLSTRFQWRWGEARTFYVLSKSLSDDDNEADIGGMVAENAYNLAHEYSFARLDRRHQFSGGGILTLPFAMEAAASVQVRSAVPIDVIAGGGAGADANNDDRSNGPDRPYHAPGVPFERNEFRNRPTSTVNIRVLKNVAVSGRGRLSILLDVFNLFNVDGIQYAGPEVTSYCASPVPMTCGFDGPSNPIFLKLVDGNGRYLLNNAPGEPRQVQLGVRFTF